MRVLIASKRAPGTPGRRDGGVQTWVSTIAAELRRRGHLVDVTGAADVAPADQYDLGIFANAKHTQGLVRFCDRAVLVVHGIVEDERPLPGFGAVAFTSEGVKRHWGGAGPIVRQPIDLEFWSPDGRSRAGVLRYAARGGLEWVAQAISGYSHIRTATHEAAREALRGAAVVLASGRCAVEAMACGAPVVICDERHYQGPLMGCGTLSSQMWENYSGRSGVVPTPDNLPQAIAHAQACNKFREHVERHHDVRRIVDQLLEQSNERHESVRNARPQTQAGI